MFGSSPRTSKGRIMSHSAPFTPKTMTLGTAFPPLWYCANDKLHPASRTTARMRLVLPLINFISAPFTESACIIAQRRYSLREFKQMTSICCDVPARIAVHSLEPERLDAELEQ